MKKLSGVGALCVAWLAAGCGGEATNGSSQSVDCAEGGFIVRGSLDGSSIDDERPMQGNVGIVNAGQGYFQTPFTSVVSLEEDQVGLRLTWETLLAYGDDAEASGETLTPPLTHPRAGETLCVTRADVGFTEDGMFTFSIQQARVGADCTGDFVPVNLNGCMN